MPRPKILILTSLAILAAVFLMYLLFVKKPNFTVLDAMPDDVLCFFDVNDGVAFQKLAADNKSFTELTGTQFFGEMKSDYDLFARISSCKSELLTDIQHSEFLCGAFISGDNKVDYLFLLDLDEGRKVSMKEIAPALDKEKPKVYTHVFENEEIYELYYPNHQLKVSFAKLSDMFMFSTSSVFIENSILQLKNGNPVTNHTGFREVAKEMDNHVDYNLYLNVEQLADYFSMFATNEKYEEIMQLKKFASWIGFHPQFMDDGIQITGYASAKNDSSDLNLMNYTGDFSINMNPVVPEGVVMLYRVQAEHLTENIAETLTNTKMNQEYFDSWAPWMDEQLLVGISESLDKNFMKRSFIIMPATDVPLAVSKLRYCVVNDSAKYRGHVVMQLNAGELAGKIAGISFPENCYGAWYANGLMLAQERIQIENMIDAIENHSTLANDIDYNEFKKQLSSSFNNSLYIDLSKSELILKNYISDKHIDSLSKHFGLLQKFSRMEIQFTENKDVFMVNGFIKYSDAPARKSGLLWKQQIDFPVESGPFTVASNGDNERNIMVQDTMHQVYMISPSGEVIWKLPFADKIMGDVHEVDFYGNDGVQLLFNTPNAIHMIDLSGNPVEGFPIEMTAHITNPLTVLYHSKSDYRLFVACDNDNIYGFLKDGKPIPGWSPLKNSGNVQYRLFTLDNGENHYIGFVNQKGIQIKKDDGTQVQSIGFKDSVVAGTFTGPVKMIMGEDGNVVSLDNDLNITEVDEPKEFISGGFARIGDQDTASVLWMDDVYLTARDLQENTLFKVEQGYASGKVITLPFGEHDYFGVITDDDQLRLYNSDGSMLEGFPVKASSRSVIDDLTQSGDKMLITVVGSLVITYRIK